MGGYPFRNAISESARMNGKYQMPLSPRDKHILDIISQYTFLNYCRDKKLISEEKRQEIVFRFGSENHEIIDYYVKRLDEHYRDTSRFLENLKKPLR